LPWPSLEIKGWEYSMVFPFSYFGEYCTLPLIYMECLNVESPKGENTFGIASCLTIKKCTEPLTSIKWILWYDKTF